MHYKALIFDLDGTAVDTKQNATPSKVLLKTLSQIPSNIIVACATGRSYAYAKRILLELKLTQPCIIFGGSQIMNPQTGEVLWKKEIPTSIVNSIVDETRLFDCVYYFTDDLESTSHFDVSKRFNPESIVYVNGIKAQEVPSILSELTKIDDIAVHVTNSWIKDCKDLHITHKEATKKFALEKWLELLNLKKEDVVAVGDSGNDIPLFESAGLKVAMANSTEDLISKADFVTKSVIEDGLAYAIEKFIISNPSF